ncbi:MAG: DnaJ domain-containing protein [Alphaproteobacteria bacterium]|nr:DnaJ domain-containing protein [Alphaproteobacteria bacterium]
MSSDPRMAMALLWMIFGVGAVFTGFFLVMRLAGRFQVAAPRALGETAVVAAVMSIAILAWVGRVPEIWLLYIMPLPTILIGYALWERFGPASGARRSMSRVRTVYLKMILDHDAGLFDGEVIKGTYRGTVLSTMTLEELRLLQVEVSPDPDSAHILNAYLDHAHAGTRREETAGAGAAGNGQGSRQQTNGAMGEEEALSLLGLSRGASAEEIKASHRRLIKQVHPDHGGTDYLAHKITEAKNLLLG